MNVLTVSAATDRITRRLETDRELADLWIQGEVSNVRPGSGGHIYWTLKDSSASLRCVMWRSTALLVPTRPADGTTMLVHGKIGVYAQQGNLQLYADHCEPAGHGDLHRQFELLKAKLEHEGLFDSARKRPLPPYPRRIGVVTGAATAALRDVCTVIGRRWDAEVVVAPTLVQGVEAAPGIVESLRLLARKGVDVILVVRGGGSLEDLWAFNNEGVARAVATCPVPVVSGVGHETDVTICDFAADVRAATPSAAAELATPDRAQLRQSVDGLEADLAARWDRRLRRHRSDLESARRRLELMSPSRRLDADVARLRVATARGRRALEVRLGTAGVRLEGAAARLQSVGPYRILDRGYAHVRRADGATVRSVHDVAPGDGLAVRVSDGTFDAMVAGQASLFGAA